MEIMNNWDARLLQLAKENPDAPGEAGELLRSRLARQAVNEFTHDLQLAHDRGREAVVTGARMSLRCGALLLKAKGAMPDNEFSTLLRVTGISPSSAENCMRLALGIPELRQRCLHRRGRISECEALYFLRGIPEAQLPDPLADLRALLQLNEEASE